MRKAFILLLIFNITACQYSSSQEKNHDTALIKDLDIKAQLDFLNYTKYIKNKDFVSYKVEKLSYFDQRVDTIVMHLYNNNTKKKANRYIALDYFSKRFSTEKIYKARKKDIIEINKGTNEFIYSKKREDVFWHSNRHLTTNYLFDFIYYVPFYSTMRNNPSIGYSKDSIIDEEHLKFFYYKTTPRTFVDDGVSYYYFVALCFNSQNLLESIDINLAVPYTDFLKEFIPKRIAFRFRDYSFEDRDAYFDSIFNPDNAIYKRFTKHNKSNPAYSAIKADIKDSVLTDTLLNYPIVNLQNDTTTIKDEEGWLLLDFWFFGCRSCKEWIYSLKEERDSLGYLVLESKGIKIMSINSLSNNPEKIRKEMAGLDADYFTYHAKGINRYFHFKSMPYYILISPQKEIMFQGRKSDLGDYSEILRIVDSY